MAYFGIAVSFSLLIFLTGLLTGFAGWLLIAVQKKIRACKKPACYKKEIGTMLFLKQIIAKKIL